MIARAFLAAPLALLIAIGGAAAQTMPSTELSVIGGPSVTTQFKTIEKPFWNEKAAADTGGRLKVNFKGHDEMGLSGSDIPVVVRRGAADIGHVHFGRTSGDFPITDATDLAGLSPTIDTFRAVVTAFAPVMDDLFKQRLGMKVLSYQSFQAQILYCRNPITSLADLKGRKVRSGGASQGDFLDHFGASAIPMDFGEVQQALATGVVDCAITGTLGGYSAKWFESAKHLYTLPINFAAGAYLANERRWAGLPGEVRSYLLTSLPKVESAMWDLNRNEGEMGILCNTTGPCPLGAPGGMQRHDPSRADLERLREALLQTVLPRWAKRCGRECVDTFNRTIGEVRNLKIAAN